jgi:hypothetical protein
MVTKLLIATMVASLSLATAAFAGESQGSLWNDTAPTIGGNGEVVSPNSLPPGFESGTTQAYQAQAVDQWFASQAQHRFAARRVIQPNG